MEKILILSVQALKEKLYIAYIMFVLKALDTFNVIEENFPNFVRTFRAAFDNMNEIYLKYDHKLNSEKVNQANRERSKAFSKFNNYVRSFTLNTSDAEKTAAAEQILQIIAMYGASNIFGQGIREISTQLVNLIEDLEDRLEAEIQLIGAEGLLADLKKAQDDFSEVYFDRADLDSETTRSAMAEARRKMTEAYRSLVTVINENIPYDTEGRYQGFVRILNVEIRTLFSHTGQTDKGSNGSSSDSDNETVAPAKYVTFKYENGNVSKVKVEVGAPIEVPANTTGYMWDKEIPELMPNKNLTFREVPIVDRETTALFHFADHTEEEIKQLVGTVLNAPANTTGYKWDPAVPETMPAEDTQYYELPIENDDNQGGDNNGGGNTGGGDNTGGGTGGNYPPGYDPDADLDPGV